MSILSEKFEQNIFSGSGCSLHVRSDRLSPCSNAPNFYYVQLEFQSCTRLHIQQVKVLLSLSGKRKRRYRQAKVRGRPLSQGVPSCCALSAFLVLYSTAPTSGSQEIRRKFLRIHEKISFSGHIESCCVLFLSEFRDTQYAGIKSSSLTGTPERIFRAV